VHDNEGRSNDIMAVDRVGRAVHLRDIAIDHTTWDWVNLGFFRAFTLREKAMMIRESCGFTAAELPKLLARPLELHASFHSPYLVRYGSNQGKPGQTVAEFGVEGRQLAVGRDRLVSTGSGQELFSAPLDADGCPLPIPKEQKEQKREREARPSLMKERRDIAALATTPDRIVLAARGQPPRAKPAVWLLAADGADLTRADMPADPLVGALAVAGTEIVACTVDGAVCRFTTRE
jgi:hypothetical protein